MGLVRGTELVGKDGRNTCGAAAGVDAARSEGLNEIADFFRDVTCFQMDQACV
jgi:hypothetical protein